MQSTSKIFKGSRSLTKQERARQERQKQHMRNALLIRRVPKPAPKGAFDDKAITITVRGAIEKPIRRIRIPPKFLFTHSPYFKRLLRLRNGGVRRYEHTDLSLDGHAMEHFAVYCMRDDINDFQVSAADGAADVLCEMLDLYLLADKLQETALKNLAITKAAAMARKYGGFVLRDECVERIYDSFGRGHKLRAFIAAQYAWAHDSDDADFLDRELALALPRDFLYDVFVAQSMKLGSRKVRHGDPNLKPQRFHDMVMIDISDDEASDTEDEIFLVD